jgi:hypothetical protein
VKSDPAPSNALVSLRQGGDAANVWDDFRLQKLWLGVEKREWRSIAVLGASRALETMQVAELLAQLAWRYRGQPSQVLDLRDLSMRLIDYQVREMREQIDAGTRLIVALRSIFENPTAAPLAKHADAVLLCVALGDTSFKKAEETLAAIGRERVIGTVLLHPRKATPGTPPPPPPGPPTNGGG